MIDLENVSKSYDKGQPAVSHAICLCSWQQRFRKVDLD